MSIRSIVVDQYSNFSNSMIYFLASDAPVMAAYGEGSGNIAFGNVDCEGSEGSLFDCPNTAPDNNCTHANDASVVCDGELYTVHFSLVLQTHIPHSLYTSTKVDSGLNEEGVMVLEASAHRLYKTWKK